MRVIPSMTLAAAVQMSYKQRSLKHMSRQQLWRHLKLSIPLSAQSKLGVVGDCSDRPHWHEPWGQECHHHAQPFHGHETTGADPSVKTWSWPRAGWRDTHPFIPLGLFPGPGPPPQTPFRLLKKDWVFDGHPYHILPHQMSTGQVTRKQ